MDSQSHNSAIQPESNCVLDTRIAFSPVELSCGGCGNKGYYETAEAAYEDGWDFAPYFRVPFSTCPHCPSASL